MSLTQEEIISSKYKLRAVPVDDWHVYDEINPVPGYFQFDWLSSRHPDLYHKFALSTVGLINKLHTLVDLTGCNVVDICIGTGRSAMGAARKAKRVFTVELYESVVAFGKNQLRQIDSMNVDYINGDREHLPLQDNSMDVAINAWAELNSHEAYRVLKPIGYLIQLGSTPSALCGEPTSLLAPDDTWVPKECAPAEVFARDYPDTYSTTDNSIWDGTPVTGPVNIHQFTYIAGYQDYTEAAAITGRLNGPKAKKYFMNRKQATFSWRLQIIIGQVSK